MSNKSTRLTFSSIYSPPFPLSHFYQKCIVVGSYDSSLHFINPGDKKVISTVRNLPSGISCVTGLKRNVQLVMACTRGYTKNITLDGGKLKMKTQSVLFWDYRIPDRLIYQIDIEYGVCSEYADNTEIGLTNLQQKINLAVVESSKVYKDESGLDFSVFFLLIPQYVSQHIFRDD